MNATARTGGVSAAIVVIAAAGSLCVAGRVQGQTPRRAAAAPTARPPLAAAPTGDRTAKSAEMNMTTYEIMMPGRDMPAKYRKPRKPAR